MKITKLGHCCLLIETKGKRILTDPGSYTVETHSQLKDIDYILFTHDHQDHYHLESLKIIIKKNPKAVIYADESVSELLKKEGINHIKIGAGENVDLDGVALSGIGTKHAEIHSSIPLFLNTGFFIDNRLFYPGDNLTDPKRAVEILALPVDGPWVKISEAIDYALKLKPKIAFPVHDEMKVGITHVLPERLLNQNGIKFVSMVAGDSREF